MAMTHSYFEVTESTTTAFLNYISDAELRYANSAENARTWNWHSPPDWPSLHLRTISNYNGKALKRVDLTTRTRGIVCSPSAFRFISPLLQRGGVNLPLHVDDGQIWSYFFMDMSGDNIPFAKITSKGVMRRNHSDMTKPLPKVPKEGVFQWRRDKHLGADFAAWLQFDPESIDGRDVFLAAYRQQFFEKVGITVPFTRLFVSERFVQAVVDAELQGLDFISVSKPEDSLWYTDPSDHQR
jgi:hypothetical protein